MCVDWRTGDGRTGRGVAHKLTAETGDFWFFEPANIEMVVKVLDGCRENGHRWVLMSGLTDVGVGITVTDSESGAAKTYRNPEGSPFAAKFDLEAFPCGTDD